MLSVSPAVIFFSKSFMKESTLYKTSLLILLLGLGFLFLYSQEFDLKVVETIDSQSLDQTVKLKGVVQSLRVSDKALFLKVTGERIETTEVIFFPQEEVFLQEGDTVEIIGTVDQYRGKKEVIASKVTLK